MCPNFSYFTLGRMLWEGIAFIDVLNTILGQKIIPKSHDHCHWVLKTPTSCKCFLLPTYPIHWLFVFSYTYFMRELCNNSLTNLGKFIPKKNKTKNVKALKNSTQWKMMQKVFLFSIYNNNTTNEKKTY